MWLEFYRTVATTIALLFIPGYLFWRGLRFSPILAMCCAPLYSACAYAALPIAYAKLGISCSAVSILAPILVLAIIAAATGRLRPSEEKPAIAPRDRKPYRLGPLTIPYDLLTPLFYILLGSLVCYFVFVHNLPHPDAFSCRFDNQTHLNRIRSFIDSGRWSSIGSTNYQASEINAQPYAATVGSGFYPCAFYCIVALSCLITGANVTTGINALIAAISAIVFPLSEYAFLRGLFPDEKDRRVVQLGAIVASGFANWPWHFLVMGPLYPNILGLTLQFAACGAVVAAIDEGHARQHPFSFAIFSLTSLATLALAHPNTVFSTYVFMAFYGATVVYKGVANAQRLGPRLRVPAAVVATALFATAVASFWALCYRIPALSGVINYGSTEQSSPLHVLASIASLKFSFTRFQVGMSLACLFGCIALTRRPDRWRVLLPAAFFALAYFSVRTGWDPIKYWTGALWYSDRRRLAMNITLFAMPIAALGLDAASTLFGRALSWNAEALGRHARAQSVATPTHPALGTALLMALVVLTFLPTIALPIGEGAVIKTAFGTASSKINERYADRNDHIYSADEIAFVESALNKIPEGALVLNAPADGSVWAYGANNLNTYYRSIRPGADSEQSALIREHLSEYATSKDVQNAVKYTGAQYVLLLDKDVSYDQGFWLGQYHEKDGENWTGITNIDDDTPGFEVILAEGDEMRLYRIGD